MFPGCGGWRLRRREHVHEAEPSGVGDLLKVRLRKCCFKERLRLRTKNKKNFQPCDALFWPHGFFKNVPHPGGGGGGAWPHHRFLPWSWWRNLDTRCKDFSKTFIHVATMSYLDTHFIKTSVINAAGKERLKIRELVNTKFQGDTLKAGEGKNRENLQTFVCTIQTSVRLSDFKELLYIFVSFQQITFKLDILTILRHSFWPYAWSC